MSSDFLGEKKRKLEMCSGFGLFLKGFVLRMALKMIMMRLFVLWMGRRFGSEVLFLFVKGGR